LNGYRGTFKVTWTWESLMDIHAELTREDVPKNYKKEIPKIRYYQVLNAE